MIERVALALLVGALAASLAVPAPSESQAVVGYLDARGFGDWQADLQGHPLERIEATVDGDAETIRLASSPPDAAGSFLVVGDGDVVAFGGTADLVVRNGTRQMTIHVTLNGTAMKLARYPMDLGFDEGVHPFCSARLERTVPGPGIWQVDKARMVFTNEVGPGSTGLIELGTVSFLDCPEAAIGLEHLGSWTIAE